ncbi:imidazolonepropionase [uncultured Aeromicrobium sp.]|uniref:imidazolonepropionase n=1 Tax=uncultured Aeromicrobium sp. TaxID=337820 RepID=UPI0025DCB34A|nr:imidazolonepropionase [uncultured Aeromicrobium sp.]
MAFLVTGIGELRTHDHPGTLRDAALVVEGERVVWIGSVCDAPDADERLDVEGRAILPGWVDSHTHLLFAGDRSAELAARMAGEAYAAGGIQVTVDATRAASDDALRAHGRRLRDEGAHGGTTTIEAKTGYGLDLATEERLARLSAEVADVVTYLGAHLVPAGVDRRDYLDLVVGRMLDAVRPHASFIDVFCERGAFTVDEAREVLLAGRAAGLGLKVHGNQLGHSGGVALAVELGATSVDHVNHLDADDIAALADSDVVATILPGADLSTRERLAPARELADAGVRLAIATNTNPGTSFTTSMPFCVTTAVLQHRLSLDEALRAATIGGAAALGLDDTADGYGRVRVGGYASFQLLDAPSAAHLPYRPGVDLTAGVWRRGRRVR